MSDFVYLDGWRYDEMFGDADDLPFWLEQAGQHGGPILELACGTGRVAIPLAEAGFEVSGIDLSPVMLATAAEKAARRGVDVNWVQGDIRDFHLDQTFSQVIFPANTLCHLYTVSDLERCLAAVRRHLRPSGHFIVDVFVPDLYILTRDPDTRAYLAEYRDEAGDRVMVFGSDRYEPDTQINRVELYRRIGEDDEELLGLLPMRMYYPQELDALLRYNGFPIEHKYGTYDAGPFGPESRQQLVVCRIEG